MERDALEDYFGQVFDRPLYKLLVSDHECHRILNERLDQLRIFTSEQTPHGLREAYQAAIEITEVSHEHSQRLLAHQNACVDLPKHSFDRKFWVASRYAQNQARKTPKTLKQLDIEDQVLLIVKDWVSTKSDEPLNSYVDRRLSHEAEPYKSYGVMYCGITSLLIDAINTAHMHLQFTGVVGGFCRGVFYRAILDEEGSKLAKDAANRKIKQKLADLGMEAIALVPGFDVMLGMPIALLDLAAALIDRERALREWHSELAEKYRLASEFINLYLELMLAWTEWASRIEASSVRAVESYIVFFNASDGDSATE